MKSLVWILIFSFYIYVTPALAKEACVRVSPGATLIYGPRKKKLRALGAFYLKPIRLSKNKKFMYAGSGKYKFWVKRSSTKLGSKTNCTTNLSRISGLGSKTRTLRKKRVQRPAQREERVSTQNKVHTSKNNKFFFGVGVGGMWGFGNSSEMEQFITKVANPNDVSKDQNPLISDVGYDFGGEAFINAGYYFGISSLDLIFSSSLGYRYNQYNLNTLLNPFSPSSKSKSSLSPGDDISVNRQFVIFKPEFGIPFLRGSNYSLEFYAGASVWYELAEQIHIPVAVCNFNLTCVKIKSALATGNFDQIGFGYSATLKFNLGSANLALTTDSLDHLLLRVGYNF